MTVSARDRVQRIDSVRSLFGARRRELALIASIRALGIRIVHTRDDVRALEARTRRSS